MQETVFPAPETIVRRNSPTYIRLRITGQYLGLYLLAFLFGLVLCSLLKTASMPSIVPYAQAHFGTLFDGCSNVLDCAGVILDSAGGDIQAMLMIFAAGFTMFCPLALSILTAWRGFALGFTSAYLCTALAEGSLVLVHGSTAFVLFLGANVLISAAFVYLSAEAVIFAHKYREICGRPKKILHAPFVRRYLFGYLTMFGFVMIVHGIYCGLSYLL